MTRKPFRLMRALLGAGPRGVSTASRFAPGGLAWLTPLLLGPACALALDIGEIQVHSALNQLFDARIPLPTLTPEELGKVSVKLAPTPMFKEFDLERSSALTNLVFSVEYNAEGQVYVKVVSTKPIQEPSLGLLVEFGWPRGKTFREFTIFLDPVRRLAQQPSDRSKTVLNAPTAAPAPPVQSVPPAVAAAPPVQPVPPAVVAASPLKDSDVSAGDRVNPEVEAAIRAEDVQAAEKPLPPLEAAPATVRVYRPGDTYGPVAQGEGLWGIALKVRPDPGISRDQMMQALFRANPHAFSKAGIGGLKTGAMLRLPSFREIADFTGSSTARQLAELEQQPMVAAATPPSPAPLATESPSSKAAASALEVFLLEPPTPLEPTVVVASPPAPASEPVVAKSEPAQPGFELAAAAPEAVAPASEPVVAKSEPAQPGFELAAAAPEAVAPTSEPVVAGPEPKIAESTEVSVTVPEEPAQEVMLEPVSVTPLLFLAVSEMIATLAQPPAMTAVLEAETVTLEPKREASVASESSVASSVVEAPVPGLSATPEPPVAPRNAIASLTAVENYSSPLEQQGWLIQAYLVSDFTIPVVAEFTGSLPAPAVPADTIVTSSVAAMAEVPVRAASESLRPPTAVDPAEPSAKVAEPSPQAYKGGDQYGPVVSNERLWDIATRVRPDPGIGREHMMKALFKANPQAFSKPSNMDSLKVGATLRIPTLWEIVEYTDSKVARQLLEQQQAAAMPQAPKPALEFTASPAPAPEMPPVSEPPTPELVAPPASAPEMPSASEPPAPELVAPPVSEPPVLESAASPTATAEAPPVPLTSEPAPAAETPPVPLTSEPAPAAETPPALPTWEPAAAPATEAPLALPAPEPIPPAAETLPAGEAPSAN